MVKVYTISKQYYVDRWCEEDRLPRPDMLRDSFDCSDYNREPGTDDDESVPWHDRWSDASNPLIRRY